MRARTAVNPSDVFIPGLAVVVLVALAWVLLVSPFYSAAVLPALGLSALVVFWIFPQAGYYLIVFLIPFDFLRKLSATSQALTISKPLGLWILLVVFVAMVADKRRTPRIGSNLWPLLIAFAMLGLLSSVVSPYRFTAFNELRRIAVGYVFLALTLVFASEGKGYYRILPRIIVGGMSICSLLSIIGAVFHISFLAQYGLDRGPSDVLRATGGSSDPNLMSAMALFSVPLLFHAIATARTRGRIVLALSLLLINLYAVILTYSRSGALLGALLLAVLLLDYGRRLRPKHLGLLMIGTLTVVVVAAIVVPASFWQRQRTVRDPTDPSIVRRRSYVTFGWEQFKIRPLIGAGPGTFKDLYGRSIYAFYYGDDDEESRFRYAHNTYLETLVGCGLGGLIFFVAILLRAFANYRGAFWCFKHSGREVEASLTKAYFYSFLTISLYLFFISALYHKYLWVSVGISQIALTLSMAPRAEPPSEASAPEGGRV